MDFNRIRHKTLKILIDNYNSVLEKYGMPDLFPTDYKKCEIPVKLIVEKLKITQTTFENASVKAIRENAIKYIENDEHGLCCTLAQNTFLFYNEKKYLNASKYFFQKTEFIRDLILILITAILTGLTTFLMQDSKNRNDKVSTDLRQDSLINNLSDSIKTIKNINNRLP